MGKVVLLPLQTDIDSLGAQSDRKDSSSNTDISHVTNKKVIGKRRLAHSTCTFNNQRVYNGNDCNGSSPELTLTASGTSHTAEGSMRTRRVTSETIASVFLNLDLKKIYIKNLITNMTQCHMHVYAFRLTARCFWDYVDANCSV